jgi:kumamolisin
MAAPGAPGADRGRAFPLSCDSAGDVRADRDRLRVRQRPREARPGAISLEESNFKALVRTLVAGGVRWRQVALMLSMRCGVASSTGPLVRRRKDGKPFVEQQNRDTLAPAGTKPWARRVLLVLTPLLVLALAVAAGLQHASAAAPSFVSIQSTVATTQISMARAAGSTATGQQLTLGVSLRSRNFAGLEQFAEAVSTPHSNVYHSYLTPAQFALAFGPTPAALNAVEHYLTSQGMHITQVYNGGLYLQVATNVGQAESAFHIHINNYQASDGRSFYANDDNIQLPSSIASSVIDVAGTEDARFSAPGAIAGHNVAHPQASFTCPAEAATTLATTVGQVVPDQLRIAYGITTPSSVSGYVSTIALAAFDGYNTTDIQTYLSQCTPSALGTAANAATVVKTVLTGSVSTALTPSTNALEVEANIEAILSLMPSLNALNVYEGTNTTAGIQSLLAKIANDESAQSVIYPYGMCEQDLGFANAQAEEMDFLQMAAQGQSVFASSGNTGAYACLATDGLNAHGTQLAVMDPASDPFVTAVGGTDLYFTAATTYNSDAGWNDDIGATGQLYASGGGVSTFWGALGNATSHTGQAGYAATTGTNPDVYKTTTTTITGSVAGVYTNQSGSPSRVVPDVSAVGDVVYSPLVTYCTVGGCQGISSGQGTTGGTGIAADVWGVTAAVASQNAAGATTPIGRVGLVSPALYTLYNQDVGNPTAVQYVTVNTVKYCDYGVNAAGSELAAALNTATTFSAACTTGTQQVFNAIKKAALLGFTSAGAGVGFAIGNDFNQKYGFNAVATGLAAPPAQADFPAGYSYNLSDTAGAPGTYATENGGFTAVTGLGTPASGAISYLTNLARYAIPRLYMVAASTGSSPTYWIASYTLNQYANSGPIYTQWQQLGSTVFHGQPAVVDNTNAAGATPGVVWIIGLNSSGQLQILQWQPSQNQLRVVPSANLPALPSGVTCAGAVSAAVTHSAPDAHGDLYVACTSTTGIEYLNYAVLTNNAADTFGATTTSTLPASWSTAWTQVGSGLTNGPTIATSPTGNDLLFLAQAPISSGDGSVWWSYQSTAVAATSDTPSGMGWQRLATTCNTTPAAAYSGTANVYDVACVDSVQHAMWSQQFNDSTSKWNTQWYPLGTPSSSVTFAAGAGIAVDNTGNIDGYGANFGSMTAYYVGEGSDGSMYLKYIEPTGVTVATMFDSIWNPVAAVNGVPVTGIFSTPSGVDFVNQ